MGKVALAAVPAVSSAGVLLSAWVVVMTASLMLVDLHRRKELALLHNLGVTTWHAVALATAPAAVFESVLVMLRG